jgi:hypothetical protein
MKRRKFLIALAAVRGICSGAARALTEWLLA